MKKYIIIPILSGLFGFSAVGSAQVTIGSPSPPAKAAILDLKTIDPISSDNVSANEGLLLPRVNLSDLESLDPLVVSATEDDKTKLTGLKVYNMNTTPSLIKGVYIWNGSRWVLHRQATGPSSGPEAGNGTSKISSALRLGGILTEATTIGLTDQNLTFEQTTGSFSVNSNALAVSGANTGIGASPSSAGPKLTVGGNMLIGDNLAVNGASASSLERTVVTDSLWIKNPVPATGDMYILKNTDATGVTQWDPVTNIPNYNASPYREAVITSGLTLSLSNWNSATQYDIPGFELRLTPGVWIVYLSVVVEPLDAAGANIAASNAQEPIWGRFRLNYYNGSNYVDPSTTLTDPVARISALNVSDRVYANVTKNVIKGYLVLRVNGAERTLHLRVSNRSQASGYGAWNGATSVRIGDPDDPQNYAVAFPL